MAKIENYKYSIGDAFRDCFYIVPDYQREYVWTDKEVQQLLDDINEQIDAGNSREYFVGTVLVSPYREESLRSDRRPTAPDDILPVALRTQAIVQGRATGSSVE